MFSGRSTSADHACGRVGVLYELDSRPFIGLARIRAVLSMLVSTKLRSSRQLAARPDAAEAAGYRTNRHDTRKILVGVSDDELSPERGRCRGLDKVLR